MGGLLESAIWPLDTFASVSGCFWHPIYPLRKQLFESYLTLECYFTNVHLKKLQLYWYTSVWIYSSHHVKLKIERIGLLIKLCPTWFLQMVVETEKCGISMKMASPEDVSEVLAHIGTCLRRIFPGLSPVWVLLGKGEESRQPGLPQNGKLRTCLLLAPSRSSISILTVSLKQWISNPLFYVCGFLIELYLTLYLKELEWWRDLAIL